MAGRAPVTVLTAMQIAEMALPGLPGTDRSVRRLADREGWPCERLPGSAGAWGYPLARLPEAVRQAIERRLLGLDAPLPVPVEPARPPAPVRPIGAMQGWQLRTLEARAGLVAALRRLAVEHDVSITAAAKRMAADAQAGALDPDLAARVSVANARGGRAGSRTLSRPTLLRWCRALESSEAKAAPRAPSRGPRVPAWAPALMEVWGRPSKPSLPECLDALAARLPDGAALPSQGQARRFLDKVSRIDRERGRMGERELRNIRPFVRRDFSDLWPTAIYVADGHTFDAEIAHPIHGGPFRPEVTAIVDVATRAIVGWSAGLVENTWGVADAIANAFMQHGICHYWYVDRGRGFNNIYMTGLMDRLGVQKVNSLPYRSQARGVVERLHQSVMIRAARKLPTFIGAKMDKEAAGKVHKITRDDYRKFGKSPKLMDWQDFTAFVREEVDAYNHRRHSTIKCAPLERWRRLLAEKPDTLIERLEPADVGLLRPRELRKATRGEVQIGAKHYYSRELEHYHGERVLVAYDIADAGRVWIYEPGTERLIGEGVLDGNKQPYLTALTRLEREQQVRTKGRLARLERDAAMVRAELEPPRLIEHSPAPDILVIEGEAAAAAEIAEIQARETAVNAPLTDLDQLPPGADEVDFCRWVLARPERATPADCAEIARLLSSFDWRLTLQAAGLDLLALQSIAERKKQA